jgi:hypothetical protein
MLSSAILTTDSHVTTVASYVMGLELELSTLMAEVDF